MGTPAQVLKDAEDAEKLWNDMYNAPKPDDKPDDKKPDDVKPDDKKPDDKKPDEPNDKPDAKPDVKPEDTPEYWKHRFEVTEGMLKSQVPDLTLRLNEVVNKLAEAERKLAEGKPAEPVKTLQALEKIEKDPSVEFLKTEYPDVWKGISTVIKELTESTKAEIEKLSSEVKKQSETVIKSSRDRFYDDLDTSVKDWEVINGSAGFNAWLDKKDRYTGVPRRELLKSAYASLDSQTAKNFFEDFAAENTPTVKDDIVEPKKPEKKPVVDSPKNAGHKPPADTDKTQPTLVKASEITKFYMDVQQGRYKGREADMKQREAELEKAIAEGRVIQ